MWDIIAPSYEHLFVDCSFCLGVQGELLITQLKDPSLVRLYDGPVRSYLYSYLFHKRYGRYPFGDRAHGTKGILQFYSELFDEPSLIKTWKLLLSAAAEEYRGHLPCPCGSGIVGRKCHGDAILHLKKSGAISGVQSRPAQTRLEFAAARDKSEKRHRALKKIGIDVGISDPVDVFSGNCLPNQLTIFHGIPPSAYGRKTHYPRLDSERSVSPIRPSRPSRHPTRPFEQRPQVLGEALDEDAVAFVASAFRYEPAVEKLHFTPL